MNQIQELERVAKTALAKAERLRVAKQKRCKHPLSALTFNYDGVSSFYPGRKEHGMYITCGLCEHQSRSRLVLHDDL